MSKLPEYLKYKATGESYTNMQVKGEKYRFTLLTPFLVRAEWSEDGTFEDRATAIAVNRKLDEFDFEIEKKDSFLFIKTKGIILKYSENSVFSADTLSITLRENNFKWKYGKKISNLGGTASTLDGKCESSEIGKGVCSQDGIALIEDESLAFDSDGWLADRIEGNIDIYIFAYGHKYIQAVRDFYRLTGYEPLIPAFALGNWWSRWYPYTEESYKVLLTRFKENDLPFSVSIIDIDWHITELPDENAGNYKAWTGYTWNKKLFPDYVRFLKWLNENGYKTALNLHPADGIKYYEEQYPDMCKALKIDSKSKETIGFDITNPEFIKPYFEILHHPYEKNGVNFWWIDWQQGGSISGVNEKHKKSYLDKMTPLWYLNHFHTLDLQRKGNRPLIFSRYAGPGSQRYPIGFSGDTIITWETLDFIPYFTATSSNIGYSWWSHDIGGFGSGYRDDELQVRWVQLGVFLPILRLHSCRTEFTGKEPWNYNKRAEIIMNDFLRLRHKLFPYIYTMNYRTNKKGLPLIQPLYYQYPECEEAYEFKNQYWFGSEMIVCPITSKSNYVAQLGYCKAWLPEGIWIDMFSGLVYKGGRKLRFYRQLEQMPVFCKAGAIVAMQAHVKGDNSVGNKKSLEIYIYAGASNKFTLYEDNGFDYSYQDGNFVLTEMSLDWSENHALFKVASARGNLSLIPKKRSFSFNFRGFNKVQNIKVLAGRSERKFEVSFDAKTSTVTVFVDDVKTDEEIEIILKSECLRCNNDSAVEFAHDIIMKSQFNEDFKNEIFSEFISKKPKDEKLEKFKWYAQSADRQYVTEALIELLLLT